jgi:hypothetical protein
MNLPLSNQQNRRPPRPAQASFGRGKTTAEKEEKTTARIVAGVVRFMRSAFLCSATGF